MPRTSSFVLSPLLLMGLMWLCGCGEDSSAAEQFGVFTVTDNEETGRLAVESPELELEFGYLTHPSTNYNKTGGNLYLYRDRRYATENVVAYDPGGTGGTGTYAPGAGGLGSTSVYATVSLTEGFQDGSYVHSMSDNDLDAELLEGPMIQAVGDGTLQLTFRYAVKNPRTDGPSGPPWYDITKIWTVLSPEGRILLEHRWKLLRSGYYSEPDSRHHVARLWRTVSRFGHRWEEPPAEPPGSNSRCNPENLWWRWNPVLGSQAECNANNGMDAVHSDLLRFHGDRAYDLWIWPDNHDLGFEGLGLYRLGYYQGPTFGSFGNSVGEVCYFDLRSAGSIEAYSVAIAAWWGGDGATRNRYVWLDAGTEWRDSYGFEIRPTGPVLPVSCEPTAKTSALGSVALVCCASFAFLAMGRRRWNPDLTRAQSP